MVQVLIASYPHMLIVLLLLFLCALYMCISKFMGGPEEVGHVSWYVMRRAEN